MDKTSPQPIGVYQSAKQNVQNKHSQHSFMKYHWRHHGDMATILVQLASCNRRW